MFIINLGNLPIQITSLETQLEALPMPYKYKQMKSSNKYGITEIIDYELDDPGEGTIMPGEKQIVRFPIEDEDNRSNNHPGYRSYQLTINYVYGPTGPKTRTKTFLIQHEPRNGYMEKNIFETDEDWNILTS